MFCGCVRWLRLGWPARGPWPQHRRHLGFVWRLFGPPPRSVHDGLHRCPKLVRDRCSRFDSIWNLQYLQPVYEHKIRRWVYMWCIQRNVAREGLAAVDRTVRNIHTQDGAKSLIRPHYTRRDFVTSSTIYRRHCIIRTAACSETLKLTYMYLLIY